MHETAFVSSLQSAAGLRHDLNRALRCQTVSSIANQIVESGAR